MHRLMKEAIRKLCRLFTECTTILQNENETLKNKLELMVTPLEQGEIWKIVILCKPRVISLVSWECVWNPQEISDCKNLKYNIKIEIARIPCRALDKLYYVHILIWFHMKEKQGWNNSSYFHFSFRLCCVSCQCNERWGDLCIIRGRLWGG